MLMSFTCKNFRSFRDEVCLNMRAAELSEHPESLLRTKRGEAYLPLSVIYGPNGGGKSNLLMAMAALRFAIMAPLQSLKFSAHEFALWPRIKSISDIKPFAFSKTSVGEPCEFELVLSGDLAEYLYTLKILQGEVQAEELYLLKNESKRKSLFFKRIGSEIKLGQDLKGFKISADLSKDLPLLSYLIMLVGDNGFLEDMLRALSDGLLFWDFSTPISEMRLPVITGDPFMKQKVLQLLHEMDLDINDYQVELNEAEQITRLSFGYRRDGEQYWLDSLEESSGTRKLFALIPYLLWALQKGSALIVDELDSKLHPLLLQHVIKMFSDPQINRRGAQLVFTSHDLNSMSSEFFRRDEIWFVAKGREDYSELYALSDFKLEGGQAVRKDASFSKQYLEGRYGADPYLQRIVNWAEVQRHG